MLATLVLDGLGVDIAFGDTLPRHFGVIPSLGRPCCFDYNARHASTGTLALNLCSDRAATWGVCPTGSETDHHAPANSRAHCGPGARHADTGVTHAYRYP